MKIVVSDTGPILHLLEAGALGLLENLGQVFVPAAVEIELGRLVENWKVSRPSWLVQRNVVKGGSTTAGEAGPLGLGLGESEAILLAREIEADWLLTDDAEARLIAHLAGIEVHGSLGVVLRAAMIGELASSEAHRLLDHLAETSLWISETVLARAHAELDSLVDR